MKATTFLALLMGSLLIVSVVGGFGSSFQYVDPDQEEADIDAEIYIVGDDDFENMAEDRDWDGSGVEDDPYIIENEIEGGEHEYDFYIEDTTVHFEIKGHDISRENIGGVAVVLQNVENGKIIENEFISNHRVIEFGGSDVSELDRDDPVAFGIFMDSCSDIYIDNNYFEGFGGHAVTLMNSHQNVLSENFIFNNEGTGIHLEDSDHNIITNNENISVNMGIGIRLESSNNNTIRENDEVWENEGVFYLIDSHQNKIEDNHITKGEAGVILLRSEYNEVSDNFFEDVDMIVSDESHNNIISENLFDGIGLRLRRGSQENMIRDNIIKNCRLRGILLRDNSYANSIVDNWFSNINDWAVEIRRDSNEVTLEGNVIEESYGGVWIEDSESLMLKENTMTGKGVRIEGNSSYYWDSHEIDESNTLDGKPIFYWKNQIGGTVPEDAAQIILANCSGVTIEDQEIRDRSVGISLGFSHENIINSNLLSENTYGIRMSHSDANLLEDNDVENNLEYGLRILYSNENRLERNEISDNHEGINLRFSDENILERNRLENNFRGVRLNYSNSNEIYHNDFIDNDNQAYDDEENRWNSEYPYGGNYWSDYQGMDNHHGPDRDKIGSDGLGDFPYDIEGGNAHDAYPLMDLVPAPYVRMDTPEEDMVISEDRVNVQWTPYRFTSDLDSEIRLDDGDWISKGDEVGHTFEGLSEGEHVVEVRVTDGADNEADDSVNFIIDTVSPELEIVSPENDEIFNEDEITVEWNAEPIGTEIVEYEISIDQNEWKDAHSESHHTFEDLSEGLHTVEVKVVDEGGNEAFESVSFIIDTVSPELEIVSPENDDIFNEDEITVEWNAEPIGTEIVEYEVRRIGHEWKDADHDTFHTFFDVDDGHNTIEVRIRDEASNENIDEVSFLVDTEPPVLNFLNPTESETLDTDSVRIEWDAEPKGTDIDERKIRLNEGEWKNAESDTHHTFEQLSDGEYSVEVKITDEAGNSEIESITFQIETGTDIGDHLWIITLAIIGMIGGAVFLLYKRKKNSESDEHQSEKTMEKTCPDCGGPLAFIQEYNRWYCKKCKDYK